MTELPEQETNPFETSQTTPSWYHGSSPEQAGLTSQQLRPDPVQPPQPPPPTGTPWQMPMDGPGTNLGTQPELNYRSPEGDPLPFSPGFSPSSPGSAAPGGGFVVRVPGWRGVPGLKVSLRRPSSVYTDSPAVCGSTADMSLAGVGARIVAYLINVAVYVIPPLIGATLLGTLNNINNTRAGLFISGGIASYMIFAPIGWAMQIGLSGQDPGMRVTGVALVSAKTYRPVGMLRGFILVLLHVLLYVPMLVGIGINCLLPLFNHKRQTLVGKITGTVAVTVPRQGFRLK
jgi:uncharacterized RDD family membrane protein YckC